MAEKVTADYRACGGHADDTCDVCQAPLCWGCAMLVDTGAGRTLCVRTMRSRRQKRWRRPHVRGMTVHECR